MVMTQYCYDLYKHCQHLLASLQYFTCSFQEFTFDKVNINHFQLLQYKIKYFSTKMTILVLIINCKSLWKPLRHFIKTLLRGLLMGVDPLHFTRVTFIKLDPEKSLSVESTLMEIFSEIS